MSEAITAHVVTVSLVSFPKKRKLKIVSISVEQKLYVFKLFTLFQYQKRSQSEKKSCGLFFKLNIYLCVV